jgi:hypothetical protein
MPNRKPRCAELGRLVRGADSVDHRGAARAERLGVAGRGVADRLMLDFGIESRPPWG